MANTTNTNKLVYTKDKLKSEPILVYTTNTRKTKKVIYTKSHIHQDSLPRFEWCTAVVVYSSCFPNTERGSFTADHERILRLCDSSLIAESVLEGILFKIGSFVRCLHSTEQILALLRICWRREGASP